MSGICGIIHFDGSPVDPALLRRLAAAAAHRGPDGLTEYLSGGTGFAHLALHSTPESVYERQPLVSDDGRLVLVADARIDNRPELIAELTTAERLLDRTPTDADLILAAYQHWGDGCASRLIGDFAFAIWDDVQRRLFCARDALGIKSLCYAHIGGAVVFASEVGQVLAHPRVNREVDRVAVGVRVVGGSEDPARTLFRDILRVRPASVLVIEATGERQDRYWEPRIDDGSPERSDGDWADELQAVLTRAVQDRLRSSTPAVAVEMSGGLDSCSIAAIAAREKPGAVVAVTYRFDQLQSCDETPYSRAVAAASGFPLRYVDAESRWFLHDPKAYRPTGESPYVGWPTITAEVCAVARQEGSRVLLTGRGGDELFGGTPAVLGEEFWRGRVGPAEVLRQVSRLAHERGLGRWRALYGWILRLAFPEPLVHGLRNRLRPSFPKWALPDPHLRRAVRNRLDAASVPVRSSRRTQQQRYEGIRDLGFSYDLFGYYDRIAAPFGIEARHPLLDQRLVEFALRLPPRCLLRDGTSKWLLRQALRGILPEDVRCRLGKTSFAPFAALALREKERRRVSALFDDSLLGRLGLVEPSGLSAAYAEYCAGTGSISAALLQCLYLELWLREHGSTELRGEVCDESS